MLPPAQAPQVNPGCCCCSSTLQFAVCVKQLYSGLGTLASFILGILSLAIALGLIKVCLDEHYSLGFIQIPCHEEITAPSNLTRDVQPFGYRCANCSGLTKIMDSPNYDFTLSCDEVPGDPYQETSCCQFNASKTCCGYSNNGSGTFYNCNITDDVPSTLSLKHDFSTGISRNVSARCTPELTRRYPACCSFDLRQTETYYPMPYSFVENGKQLCRMQRFVNGGCDFVYEVPEQTWSAAAVFYVITAAYGIGSFVPSSGLLFYENCGRDRRKTLSFMFILHGGIIVPWMIYVALAFVLRTLLHSLVFVSQVPFFVDSVVGIIPFGIICGISIFFGIMFLEASRARRKYTLLSAAWMSFAGAAIGPLLVAFGNFLFITLPLWVIFLLLGIAWSLYGTKLGSFLSSPGILQLRDELIAALDATIVSSQKLTSFIEYPEAPLLTGLGAYINNETFSDVSFQALGKEVFLHKIVLFVRAPELLDLLERKDPTLDSLFEGFGFDEIILFVTLIYTGQVHIPSPEKMRAFIAKLERLRSALPMEMFPKGPLTDCLHSTKATQSQQIALKEKVRAEIQIEETSEGEEMQKVESSTSSESNSAAGEFEVLAHPDRLVISTSADFGKAFDNPSFADAKLVTSDGVEFANLHRVILAAQSDYFKVLFSSRWHNATSEKNTEPIEAHLLANILHVMYANHLAGKIQSSTVVDLLIQSQYFLFDRLRGLSESFIAARINHSDVQQVYELGCSLHARGLMKACEFYANKKRIQLEDHSANSVELFSAPSGTVATRDNSLLALDIFDDDHDEGASLESYLFSRDERSKPIDDRDISLDSDSVISKKRRF